ncbi:hypothetical protein PRIPAC_83067 [Pristionchus pacificus]|uniref:Uncharacterized protein n=1 Tax=Pristionchus pacificus TaxID=54126 RepID=A0A2A6CQ06_PRIPA|nr:hypothetical protein PRIPAC_83067 [Pristionchus pacificus]|eukprot:PDM80295.1 hypothetical protein PRIPAC_32874 [Pristionchus pacificus]
MLMAGPLLHEIMVDVIIGAVVEHVCPPDCKDVRHPHEIAVNVEERTDALSLIQKQSKQCGFSQRGHLVQLRDEQLSHAAIDPEPNM